MFSIKRRKATDAGVRFCDACATVTTAAQRSRDRYERTRTEALTWTVR